MSRLPDAIFVVDTRKEKIAVDEARKLKIPVIGIVDTNCDPDEVDFVIPGNDDALRAIRLFASKIADAVTGGRGMRESRIAEEDAAQAEEAAAADAAARLTRAVRPQRRDPSRRPPAPRARGHGISAGSRAGALFVPPRRTRWRRLRRRFVWTDEDVRSWQQQRLRQIRSSSFATRPARA